MITIATSYIYNTNNIKQTQTHTPTHTHTHTHPHTHAHTSTYRYDLIDDVNEVVQLTYTTPYKYMNFYQK